jgi:hypothetical protein
MENREVIYSLVVTALEGGSYSCFCVDGEWEKAWRGADAGKAEAFAGITISDGVDDNCNEAGPPAELTDQRLTEAWAHFQTKAPRHFADAITENDDVVTGDVFLQILAFGEIIYG